jgi:hypothetical protein
VSTPFRCAGRCANVINQSGSKEETQTQKADVPPTYTAKTTKKWIFDLGTTCGVCRTQEQ